MASGLVLLNLTMGETNIHNSESQGQQEAGCMQQTSKLFTGSTALKLVNILNKLP